MTDELTMSFRDSRTAVSNMAMNGWLNFCEVDEDVLQGHGLFRSSAPHYNRASNDTSQNLADDSVDFLNEYEITRIISFNSHPYSPEMRARLERANIEYLHIPIVDYGAPDIPNLLRAIEFYRKAPNGNTLVHCGLGRGR